MSLDLNLSLDTLVAWKRKPHAMVEDLFGVKPDPWQREALEAFPHAPRMAMKACAGPGKTALLAWIGWNFLLAPAASDDRRDVGQGGEAACEPLDGACALVRPAASRNPARHLHNGCSPVSGFSARP